MLSDIDDLFLVSCLASYVLFEVTLEWKVFLASLTAVCLLLVLMGGWIGLGPFVFLSI